MDRLYISTATFVIRSIEGTPEDLEQILEVYRQCEDFLALGPVAHASPGMVQADLEHSRQEGGVFCGIYDPSGACMLGIVDFVVSGFEGDPGLAFLSLLMIAAPYRQHGLGESVVRAVEGYIRQDGRARALRSGVQVNNPAAIRFWRRTGFEIISGAKLMEDSTVAYQLNKTIQ